jgi:hypothetical protein
VVPYYSQSATKTYVIFIYFYLLLFFSLIDPLLICDLSILEKVMGSSGSAGQNFFLKIAEVFVVDWLQYGITL